MSNANMTETRPTWMRLSNLRSRWGGISRTKLFYLQQRHPELASEYPFGPGLPMIRMSNIEAFEKRQQPAAAGKAPAAGCTAAVTVA